MTNIHKFMDVKRVEHIVTSKVTSKVKDRANTMLRIVRDDGHTVELHIHSDNIERVLDDIVVACTLAHAELIAEAKK